MAERDEDVLSYAVKPRWRAVWGPVLKRVGVYLGVTGWILFVVYCFVRGPTSGEIRLDTGDMRYCWWGVPVVYERMSEPTRSKLLALAAVSPAIRGEWVTCVRYPLPTSNDPSGKYTNSYYRIGMWAGEDPKIARWALEDLAGSVRGGGLPQSALFIRRLIADWKTEQIERGWREDAEVKRYCAVRGYVPVAAAVTTQRK